ncbi:MAG: response regulator [Lachnospiraceae bacterium]|nr:response regulator [Lachnospiraceae bacterium]
MERELTVILIEDDAEACDNYKVCIDAAMGIKLSAITNNSFQAIDLVKEWLPDAIILDLELNEGKGSGLKFMQELNNLDLSYKPFIMISTNNSSQITYDYARELGADFIMSKHQPGYSENAVIELLTTMRLTIQANRSMLKSEIRKLEAQDISRKNLIRLVAREMDVIGISPKAVGYRYLIDAIVLVVEGTTHNLATIIGQKYQKTNTSVERAMQGAIDKTWRTSDIDMLSHHYKAKIHSQKGIPTVTEFVFYYANKIEFYR